MVNSGMFVGRAGAIVNMFASYEQQVRSNPRFHGRLGKTWYVDKTASPWETGPFADVARAWSHNDHEEFSSLLSQHFPKLPNVPFDDLVTAPAAKARRVLNVRITDALGWPENASLADMTQIDGSKPGHPLPAPVPAYLGIDESNRSNDSIP